MSYQYTNAEYLDMVRVYALANDSLLGAVRLYKEMFPNRRTPTSSVIFNANQRLRDFGQFTIPTHAQARGGKSYSDSVHDDIVEYFEQNPHESTRSVARKFGVSQWTVWNQLNEHGLHPYRSGAVQKLRVADYESRINFCRWYLENTDKNILFTDEATFNNLGVFNVHSENSWSLSNPNGRNARQDDDQQKFSVTVWAGILNNSLLGPYFIEGKLDSTSYLNILKSVINNMLDDVPLSCRRNLFYQHEGAPAHFQKEICEYLNTHFEDRWIGRGGPVQWPSRSPDLTPLQFYVWDEVNRLVYTKEYTNKEELKKNILSAFETIKEDPLVLNSINGNMRKRAELCIKRDGGHFEQLLMLV